MARQRGYLRVEGLTIPSGSSGWKTLLQLIAPSDQLVEITSYGLYPRGTVNSSPPIRCRLVKQTTAGTGGTSAAAGTHLVKRSAVGSENLRSTGQVGPWSAEPTSTDVQDLKATHPQMAFEEPAVSPDQWLMRGGERWGLQVWNDGGEAGLLADADISFEE